MGYNIIRPRRGIKSLWDRYKSRVYAQGEMLVESPEEGIGSGHVNVKFGDGVNSYENLPYAIEAPTDEIAEGSKKPLTSHAGFLLKKLIEAIDLSNFASKTHKHTKSEITDFPESMPASDVSSWAKASTKPGYSWDEIDEKPNSFTPSSHSQAANTITAGTLGGKVQANAAAAATVTAAQVRDIYGGTSDMTAGSSSLTSGTIYVMYE